MSDIEAECLKTTPGVFSDVETEPLSPNNSGVRSVSSIDFVHTTQVRKLKPKPKNMQGDSGYAGFMPGQQKPPHHDGRRMSQINENPRPLKRQSSAEFNVDLSESSEAGSPRRREPSIVPRFSVSGPSRESEPPSTRHMATQEDIAEEDEEELTRKKHKKDKRSSRKSKRTKEWSTESDIPIPVQMREYAQYSRSTSDPPVRNHSTEGIENPVYSGDNEVTYRRNLNRTATKDTLIHSQSASQDGNAVPPLHGLKSRDSTLSAKDQKVWTRSGTIRKNSLSLGSKRTVDQVINKC